MSVPLNSVAIVGAGSLRCGASVLAALLTREWHPDGRLALCDVHSEALDLYDRLARVLAAYQELEISILSTSSALEALEGKETVILCFGLGERRDELLRWQECALANETRTARCVLLHPMFERVNEWLHEVGPTTVVNMVSPVEMTGKLLAHPAVHIDWPIPVTEAGRIATAHQVLRWVRGDEPPFEPLRLAEGSPIVDALEGRIEFDNKFDPTALTRWFAELDALGGRP